MLHLFTLLADVPNVSPDYSTPATPFLNKLLSLFLGLLTIGMVFVFFAGAWKLVSSLGGHREGGAGQGAAMIAGSAIFIAVLAGGTTFINQWVHWFGG